MLRSWGGCAAGLMLAVKASPVLVRGLNTAKPRTLFPVPFAFPLLACMVFSVPVLGCVWRVWLGWYDMSLDYSMLARAEYTRARARL